MKNPWLNKLSLWLIDDGERHWISAQTKEEAFRYYCEPLCDSSGNIDEAWLPCDKEEICVEKVADITPVPVRMIDEGNHTVTKSAAEWAADGEGLVASTVY